MSHALLVSTKTSALRAISILLIALGHDTCSKAQAQFPTAAPAAPCPEEDAAVNSCLTSAGLDNFAAIACGQCSTGFISTLPQDGGTTTTCTDLTALICSSVQDCDSVCGSGRCEPDILTWWDCVANTIQADCFAGCGSAGGSGSTSKSPTTPTSPSSPSPNSASPPSQVQCPDEKASLATCIQSTGNFEACKSCGEGYFPGAGAPSSCDELERLQCGLASACPSCGDCQNEQVAVVNCLQAGACVVECSGGTGTSSPGASPTAASPSSEGGTNSSITPVSPTPGSSLPTPGTSPISTPSSGSRCVYVYAKGYGLVGTLAAALAFT